MNVNDFIGTLEGRGCHPHRTASGWEAKCPSHEDGHASLSVSEGGDGRVLLHCFAGCTPEAICEAVGCKLADPFPPRDITDSLTGFAGLHISDVSDGSFLLSREKRVTGQEGTEEQNIQRYEARPVRNVRTPDAVLIPDALFWNLLATWRTVREHPRWRDRPELRREDTRLGAESEKWRPRFGFPKGDK
jgi:hypothetical protein